MKITRVEARDVFQHKKLDYKIEGALIGIIGPNGRGKSNLLNLVRFGFSGEVPEKTKDQLLRWGAPANGEVKISFVHGGIAGYVLRTVPSGRVEFVYGEHIRATGVTAVAEAILANLGLDKAMVQLMFVPQGQLDAILFDLPSKRELAFQSMCGIGDSAKIHKRLGEVIADKFPALPDYDGQIAIAIQQAEQYKREEQDFTREISNWQAQLAAAGDEDLVRQSRAQMQRIHIALTQVVERTNSILKTQAVIDADKPAAERLRAATEGIDLAAIDKSLADANTQWRAAMAYKSAKQGYEQAQQAAQKVVTCPVDQSIVANLKQAADALQTAVGGMAGTIKMYDDLHKVLAANKMQGTSCPLCGSAISDVQTLKTRITAQLTEMRAAYQLKQTEFTKASGDLNSVQREIAIHQGAAQTVQQQMQRAEQLLRVVAVVDVDPAGLEIQIKMIEEVRRDMATLFQQKASVEARLDSNLSHLKGLQENLATAWKAVEECPDFLQLEPSAGVQMVVTVLGQMESRLQTIQTANVQLAGYQGRLGQLQQAQKNLQTTSEDLEKRRGQQDTYKKVVQTLTNVRDSMHYSALPHTLAVCVMTDLSEAVCAFLERLNAPYRVRTSTTDLSFQVNFIDGREEKEGGADASVLSGGERVMLAMAFRLASYSMFSSKCGLLALDEITVYLDEANIGNVCGLLVRVKEIAKNLDLQVLLTTHERTLLPHFDQVIDLTPID